MVKAWNSAGRDARYFGRVLFFVLGLFSLLTIFQASASYAQDYYVSPAGNDASVGTRSSAPWATLARVNEGPHGLLNGVPSAYQPGDRILLQAGGVWNGEVLQPAGSGAEGRPIVIDQYGKGSKPQINAKGAFPVYQGAPRTESAAIWLYNQSYWDIRNLDITNYVASSAADLLDATKTSDGFRWGILAEGENGGGSAVDVGNPDGYGDIYELRHLHFLNNNIHDVEGFDNQWSGGGTKPEGTQKEKSTGGINLNVRRVSDVGLKPVEDVYVRESAPATNFNGDSFLQVKGNTSLDRKTLLNFDISSVKNTITGAVLQVHGRNMEDGSSVAMNVYRVSNDWNEATMTWHDLSGLTIGSVPEGTVTVKAKEADYKLDVSAYVKEAVANGDTTVSFLLDTSVARLLQFNSREAGTGQPQLIVSAPDTKRTRFRDVLIEGNTISHVNATALATRSLWDCRVEVFNPNRACAPSDGRWTPSLQIVVRNNHLDNMGRDGMTIRVADGALVESNVVANANQRSGRGGVGMFAFDADHTLFQFNEVYGTYTDDKDGQGLDIDYMQDGTIFQYNYSHDNAGGFMESTADGQYGYSSRNGVFRYNISKNDQRRIFRFSGGSDNIQVYGNTVYLSSDFAGNITEFNNWGKLYPQNGSLTGNIIYNSSLNAAYDWGPSTGSCSDHTLVCGFTFMRNVLDNAAGAVPAGQPVNGTSSATLTASDNVYIKPR